MTLGEKILYLRKENNLSQEELAEKLGVSRQAVSKWELGDTLPDIEKIISICRLFSISSDCLLIGSDFKPECEIKAPEAKESKAEKIYHSAKEAAKKYGYFSGYVLMAIGIANIITAVLLALLFGGINGILTEKLSEINVHLNLSFLYLIFAFMALFALFALVAGLIIVIRGRKRQKRKPMKTV